MNTNYIARKLRENFIVKNILKWIMRSLKEYTLVGLLFIIGIFIGVMVINNCKDGQIEDISLYIDKFVQSLKNGNDINKMHLLGTSIKNNFILVIILWIAGTTVIGLPIVLFVIMYRGLCLGYTIAAFSYTLGKFGGICFCLISMFLQKILFIPALLTLGVSSIKLYKTIVKERDIKNMKIGIIKHTIVSGLTLGIMIISTCIENMISIPLLQNLIKYF